MSAKRIATLREPKVQNAEWVLCKTDEVDSNGKPIYVSKNIYYTDAACTEVDWETHWVRTQYNQTKSLMVNHFGLTGIKAEEILD